MVFDSHLQQEDEIPCNTLDLAMYRNTGHYHHNEPNLNFVLYHCDAAKRYKNSFFFSLKFDAVQAT